MVELCAIRGNRDSSTYDSIFLLWTLIRTETIHGQDISRAREIYKAAVQLVPHKRFTFAKLWILFARFEVRQLDLIAARKTLGAAIGMCPKEGLFKGYIQLELELREFDRVRTLYEKYLEVRGSIPHSRVPHI